jgi:hypothetical protein
LITLLSLFAAYALLPMNRICRTASLSPSLISNTRLTRSSRARIVFGSTPHRETAALSVKLDDALGIVVDHGGRERPARFRLHRLL